MTRAFCGSNDPEPPTIDLEAEYERCLRELAAGLAADLPPGLLGRLARHAVRRGASNGDSADLASEAFRSELDMLRRKPIRETGPVFFQRFESYCHWYVENLSKNWMRRRREASSDALESGVADGSGTGTCLEAVEPSRGPAEALDLKLSMEEALAGLKRIRSALNEGEQAVLDVWIELQLAGEEVTGSSLAEKLNGQGLQTANGKSFSRTTCCNALARIHMLAANLADHREA